MNISMGISLKATQDIQKPSNDAACMALEEVSESDTVVTWGLTPHLYIFLCY